MNKGINGIEKNDDFNNGYENTRKMEFYVYSNDDSWRFDKERFLVLFFDEVFPSYDSQYKLICLALNAKTIIRVKIKQIYQ